MQQRERTAAASRPSTVPGAVPAARSRGPEIVATFIGAWNAETLGERRRLLELTCNEQTHFVSSSGEHWGIGAELEAIAAFRRLFPRGRCAAQLLMEHHGWLLISWTTEFGDGRPPLRGIDAGTLGSNGRIAQLVSFSPLPYR